MIQMESSDEEFNIEEEIQKYRNLVLSTCASLGGLEKKNTRSETEADEFQYVMGDECAECLKDLKRYIRIDELSQEKLVLKWLAEWKVLEKDLIPIFVLNAQKWTEIEQIEDTLWYKSEEGRGEDYRVVCLCMDLFVFMTWSMDTQGSEVREEFNKHLLEYKRAFCSNTVVSLLIRCIGKEFEAPIGYRTDKDKLLIYGGLYILRNLLGVQEPFASSGVYGFGHNPTGIQDWFISVVEQECGIDMIIAMSSTMDDKSMRIYAPIVMDIIYSLYQRVSVDSLIGETQANDGLEEFHMDESRKSHGKMRVGRHSRFGGVFAGSIEPGKLIPIFNATEAMKIFARPLRKMRAPINKRISNKVAQELKYKLDEEEREVSLQARGLLRNTSVMFIKSGLGVLCPELLESIELQRNELDDSGVARVLYLVGYFLEIFTKVYKNQQRKINPEKDTQTTQNDNVDMEDEKRVDFPYVAKIVNTGGIGITLRQLSYAMDSQNWPISQSAMYSFRSILSVLKEMIRSGDIRYAEAGGYILNNLFYDGNVMDLMASLSGSFKPTRHTLRYVLEMIRTVEEFVVTLKSYHTLKRNMYVRKKLNKSTESDGDDDDDGDGDNEDVYVDRSFDFNKWQRVFCTKKTVASYCILIRACALLKGADLKIISEMIYRIAVVCEKPHLFYTKDLFKSFYELLANFKAIQSIKSNDPTWFEAINAIHDDVVYIFRTYFRLSSNLRAPRDNPPPNYTQHSMTTDNEQYSAASEKHNLSAVGSIDSSLHYHDSTAMETATEAASNMTSTVKRRNKTYSEDDLFFDKTHSVRVQAYISSTAAGKNPDRYPALNKSELSYADLSSDSDNRLGIDTDSDASSAGAGSNGVGAEGSKYNISGFKSWNSKVTESVNSLIVNNKRFVVEWLITQFQRFVEFKKARTLNDSNASDGNDDQGMDDTDYLLQLDSGILEQCTSDSDLINLFELFRVNKSLTLANCYVISGLETIQDFSEHIELLDSVLHPITALPVSVGSKNKSDANRSSKPRSKKLSKKRHKKSRKDEGVDVAAMQSILSSDRFDSSIFTSAPNSTLQITNNPVVSFNLTSNANSNSNTNSSTNSNGKVTSTRSGIDSIKNTFIDSDSDVDPDAIFSGSNKRSAHSSRSKLLQPYLDSDSSPPPSPANTSGQQGTDETDDIGTSVSNKPRTRSSARSRDAHTDDKVNSTATGQRVGGSSSTQDFKQRALLLRRKLIKKKRVLVRKSKID